MCAAFNQTYFGKVMQNRWWGPVVSPRKWLLSPAPSEPSEHSKCICLGGHLDSQASRWDQHVVFFSQDFGQLLSFQLTG